MDKQILTSEQFNQLTTQNGWKWVKLTNQTECHNGFQFQTGLNIDTKEFNPQSNCNDGIYFCIQEDSPRWARDHAFIRSVTIPSSSTDIVVVDWNNKKAKAHQVVLGPRQDLWTVEYYKLAAKQYQYTLGYVPEQQRTYELYKVAIQHNGYELAFVPVEKRTDELCKLAVRQNGCVLHKIPLEKRTDELYEFAIQQNGYALQYVPMGKHTDKLYKLAVQQNGYVLYNIPLKKQTDELYKLAIQQNGYALQYVPLEKRTDELCKLAIQQNGCALQYVPIEKQGWLNQLCTKE